MFAAGRNVRQEGSIGITGLAGALRDEDDFLVGTLRDPGHRSRISLRRELVLPAQSRKTLFVIKPSKKRLADDFFRQFSLREVPAIGGYAELTIK